MESTRSRAGPSDGPNMVLHRLEALLEQLLRSGPSSRAAAPQHAQAPVRLPCSTCASARLRSQRAAASAAAALDGLALAGARFDVCASPTVACNYGRKASHSSPRCAPMAWIRLEIQSHGTRCRLSAAGAKPPSAGAHRGIRHGLWEITDMRPPPSSNWLALWVAGEADGLRWRRPQYLVGGITLACCFTPGRRTRSVLAAGRVLVHQARRPCAIRALRPERFCTAGAGWRPFEPSWNGTES